MKVQRFLKLPNESVTVYETAKHSLDNRTGIPRGTETSRLSTTAGAMIRDLNCTSHLVNTSSFAGLRPAALPL